MNAHDMYPSKYLKSSDLGNNTPVVTIGNISNEIMGSEEEKESKPVVYFEGKDKGLVCNKTNWMTLIGFFGEETDDWIGKKIKLVTAEVPFKGKMTLAIRVSSVKVAQGSASSSVKPKAVVESEDHENADIAF